MPLLLNWLPEVYIQHVMLLVGGVFRLLKESITLDDRNSAASYLKLFCAQASLLYGKSHNLFKMLNNRSAPQDNIFIVLGTKNKINKCVLPLLTF